MLSPKRLWTEIDPKFDLQTLHEGHVNRQQKESYLPYVFFAEGFPSVDLPLSAIKPPSQDLRQNLADNGLGRIESKRRGTYPYVDVSFATRNGACAVNITASGQSANALQESNTHKNDIGIWKKEIHDSSK